jgi:hypothetical protein
MERLAASWIKAMAENCSLKPNLRDERPVLSMFKFLKNMSGNERQRLREECVMVGHVQNLLELQWC